MYYHNEMPPWTVRVSRLVFGAVLAACTVGVVPAETAASQCDEDKRCQAMEGFFRRYNGSLVNLSGSFLRAAGQNGLDWRLLPALAIVETGGGKIGGRNNIFGWNSGRTRFPSVDAGISHVAGRLANSPVYAGRTARGILAKYNPARSKYVAKVVAYMQELSPEPVQ